MLEGRLVFALEFRNNAHSEHLAQLYAPLVKRVDLPDGSLNEDAVFIECHKLAKCFRSHLFGEDDGGWAIALEGAVQREPLRSALGAHLFGGLAEGQSLGLGEDVGHEQVVMTAEWVERLVEADEVAGNQLGSLVNELIEGVLTVGS